MDDGKLKRTGIVRNIGKEGRISIPMEIRKIGRFYEGDPMEIFLTENGDILLKKFPLSATATDLLNELQELVYEYRDQETAQTINKSIQEIRNMINSDVEKGEAGQK